MDNITLHIEALIFASDIPISIKEIKQCIETIAGKEYEKSFLQNKILALQQKYISNSFSFQIVEIAKGYQFLSKEDYNDTISTLLKQKSKKKLVVKN